MEEKGDRENKVHDYQMEGDIKEKPFNELEPKSDQVGTSPVPMDMDQRTNDTKTEKNDSSDLDKKNISEPTTTFLEILASLTRTLKSSNSLNISQGGARPKSFKTKLHRKTPTSETITLKSSNSLNISARPKSFKTKLPWTIFDAQRVEKELLEKVKKNRKEEMKRKEELIYLEIEAEIEKKKREREDAKARIKQLKKQAQLSDVQREGKELIDKLVDNRQLEKKKQNEEIELAKEAVIEKGERGREDANASQIRQNKEAQKQSLWEKAVAQINKGNEYLKGGKYGQAILFYKAANMICPAENRNELSTSCLDIVEAIMDEKLTQETRKIPRALNPRNTKNESFKDVKDTNVDAFAEGKIGNLEKEEKLSPTEFSIYRYVSTENLSLLQEDIKIGYDFDLHLTKENIDFMTKTFIDTKHRCEMKKALDDVTWLCVMEGLHSNHSSGIGYIIVKKSEKKTDTTKSKKIQKDYILALAIMTIIICCLILMCTCLYRPNKKNIYKYSI